MSGDESDEEEGEGESKAEVTLKMKQAMLEEEKQALLQNKEMLDEVRTLFDKNLECDPSYWLKKGFYCPLLNF